MSATMIGVMLGCLLVATPAFAASSTPEERRRMADWVEQQLVVRSRPEAFSFTCGGVPSEGLLEGWSREHVRRPLGEEREQHTLTFRDPATGLEVIYTAVHYTDDAAVELLLEIGNSGPADTPVLSHVRTLDTPFPVDSCVLHRALGDSNSAESFMPQEDRIDALHPGPISLSPGGGRSSNNHMPYFNLAWEGGGAVIAVGWAGEWQVDCAYEDSGHVRFEVGMRHFNLVLHPGECIRLPRVLLQFWSGSDPLRGNNLFRRWMLDHNLPRRNGELVMPPICGTVARVEPDGSYEGPHIEAMQPLADRHVEVFWSDMDPQQWYPIGFPDGTGTWEPDPVKYPNGLAPIGQAAHDAGLGYLLWFEPERVASGTRIEELHPEWITRGNPYHLFKLHLPEARAWLTDYIDVQVSAADLDWIRWDFNIEPLNYWLSNDAPDRQGITEIRHVEGLYAMWQELFRRHPGLVVDVCASGGRRLDFETLRYGLPLWHSDRQCFAPEPEADQLQNGALFRWIPLHGCGNMGLEPSYLFRSAMTNGNIVVPASAEFGNPVVTKAVRQSVALYRKLRPLMLGDFYPLFAHDADRKVWYGYQFHRDDLDAGFALLFRRQDAPRISSELGLQALGAAREYEISYEGRHDSEVLTGEALRALTVAIEEGPDSEIVYYRAR